MTRISIDLYQKRCTFHNLIRKNKYIFEIIKIPRNIFFKAIFEMIIVIINHRKLIAGTADNAKNI